MNRKLAVPVSLLCFWLGLAGGTKAESLNVVDRIPSVMSNYQGSLSTLYIKENHTPFVNGESFRVTLPEGVKWNLSSSGKLEGTADGVEREDAARYERVSDRTLEVRIQNIGSGGLEDLDEIRIPLDITVEGATGDLLLTVEGRDSVITSGQYQFATVPVQKEIKLSTEDLIQAEGIYTFHLRIQESSKNTFERNKPITLSLPHGFVFMEHGETETLKGNKKGLEMEGIGTSELKIKMNDTPTEEASEWKIPISYKFQGEALLEEGTVYLLVNGNRTDLAVGSYKKDQFKKIIYQIGNETYHIGEVEKKMDVAPYIKGGRTFLPVRYVAEALGLRDDQILWNGTTKTVYMTKDGRSIQIPLNEDYLILNNGKIPADGLAAEMMDNRVMVSIRNIMELFEVEITWEADTQSVIVRTERTTP
ncbi:copper amine oxidase N-terminal domain-containing protein [Ammoniphilus sp. CFH 90114]|uniref:copper amine oxidase N-terminal domain-containing protein n=1 Tax=Ammoniphilus sp. CFH 90114 TaxID=2493665 RepID=UPI00100E18AC|nr:copper amine oxidase N-terminal domain-containing protein [Ammoniphilus sp. CFH 90114]RXT04529.1 copper amine oxidase N-terminal domain-containing protein [Ammoniphilus sp. CFH 90114]